MEALLPPLIVALLAEWGDRTQLLAILLATRFPRHGAVIAGIAFAALANSILAAFGGQLFAQLINFRAIGLLLALALLGIGIGNLIAVKPTDTARDWRLGAFATSALAFFILEFGDKTQFATAALAARNHSIALTAIGAAIGIVVANVPAVLLGDRLTKVLPLRAIRIGVAVLFCVTGLWIAVGALRLI